MNNKLKFSTYDMAIVGVMAAIIFTITYFIRIPMTMPNGDQSMIKVANAFILLAGILFGGLRGGLAAGIGSMIFDLLDPRFTASAPYTLVFFFLMAYICGKISHANGKNGENKIQNLIAMIVGSLSYIVLSQTKSIITKTIQSVGISELFTKQAGEAMNVAMIAAAPKLVISLVNMVIAVTIAFILAPLLKTGLQKAGLYKRLAK